jgi:hypothetical protein
MPHIADLQLSSPSPPPEKHKQKSGFSSGKHPLKNLFPFHGPLGRRSAENNEKLSNPSDNSPTESPRSFMLRFSSAIGHLASGRVAPSMIIDQDRIISNKMRRNDGPDTPLPTKTGHVHVPAFIAGISASKISASSVFHGSVFRNSVFRKSGAGIADALVDTIGKARKRARIKSSDERRRDKLRKQIVFLGPTEQTPDGVVRGWM